MSKTEKSRKNKSFAYAFQTSLPIMAGYLVLGMGFGISLESRGYAWWWAALMSAVIYAGSMQYVAVGLLSGGAGVIATAMMTIMVNIRHFFYGITMLEPYRDTGRKKPYLIFALTDETFSLVCVDNCPEGVNREQYCFFVSALNQLYWITGSILGGLAGHFIPFSTTGIDFSMTALFTVIFVEQWEKNKNHLPAVTGLLITTVCLLLFGQDNFLIPAMLLYVTALFIEKPWIEKQTEQASQI